MRTVLITGTTGMLGAETVQAFLEDKGYAVFGLSRKTSPLIPDSRQIHADLAQPASLMNIQFQADVVIHTAAVTDLNACQRDPAMAHQVHVVASELLTSFVKPGGVFYYISTDSVFDGKKGNYSESDQTNPLNVYASTKLQGEHAVRKNNAGINTSIVRTNIYGVHQPVKNSLCEWALQSWMAGKSISGFSDIIFNAVNTRQLASVLKYMTDKDITPPVLNVASNEVISKFDFLNRFREKLGFKPSLLERAVSDDFPAALERPKDTSLNTKLLSEFYTVPGFDAGFQLWIERAQQYGVLRPGPGSG